MKMAIFLEISNFTRERVRIVNRGENALGDKIRYLAVV